MKFARLPSVCQRCYHPVPRTSRNCPACGVSLERIEPLRVVGILAGSLLVFACLATTAVELYQLLFGD